MKITESMIGFINKDNNTHRYHSWWLCYEKFQNKICNPLSENDYHELSLILGMYLASWGMGISSHL